MSNEPNGFAKYLVIFVDILGSQNRVDFQETYKINKIFHEELERNKQNDMMHTVYFRKIYTFSDCAYIFYGFKDGISDERKDEGELFKVALCNCEPIFLRFIKERILFRGGISYGDAYVDPSKSMFFGDAVNKAYKMESEIAIHPRIVIDDYIAEAVLENISSVKYKIVAKKPEYISILGAGLVPKMPETGEGIIEQDIDEKYIGSVIDLEALTKISRQLDVSMGDMMGMMYGFSVIIFLVVIYLLSKVIIEKNAQSISMTKILGYTNGEISRLYILSTSFVVMFCLLLSLPVERQIMEVLFREMMLSSISGWITMWVDPMIYVKMTAIGIAAYGLVAVLEFRRIRHVPMDEALKNVE